MYLMRRARSPFPTLGMVVGTEAAKERYNGNISRSSVEMVMHSRQMNLLPGRQRWDDS